MDKPEDFGSYTWEPIKTFFHVLDHSHVFLSIWSVKDETISRNNRYLAF